MDQSPSFFGADTDMDSFFRKYNAKETQLRSSVQALEKKFHLCPDQVCRTNLNIPLQEATANFRGFLRDRVDAALEVTCKFFET